MVYNYQHLFEQHGVRCTVSPLFDDRYFGFGLLSRPTRFWDILRHAGYFAGRVAERLRCLTLSGAYDVVVVEKELLPYFPHGIEGLLLASRPRIVTLYDDATFAYYRRHPSPLVRLLCRDKIARVMRASSHIVVWNDYLAEFARRHNRNVTVVNTAVDLARYRVKEYTDGPRPGPVVLGWIGTPNSFRFIRELEDAFRHLSAHHDVALHVISSEPYESSHIRVVNKRWSVETEVDDLLELDIGIMPLPDNEWTRGKSAAKAVQYMAAGVPCVCSPVGVNLRLIDDGRNGYLATTAHEWASKLAMLIESPDLRREIGLKGRATVEAGYSLEAVAPLLIRVFEQVAAGGRKESSTQ